MTRSGSAHGTTVREAVFQLLRHHGMTTIFGNPGSTELPLFSDLPEGFRYVTGLQESVVVAMADGHALASGGPAFVNLHSAAGVGHAMGSIYSAFRNRAPVVITAGQQSRPLLRADPFLYAEAPTELPQPYVKWAIEPARAEDVPAAIARAIHMACLPPAGPVFVSIPLDDWAQPCELPALRKVTGQAQPDAATLGEIAAQLNGAADPVFVVGAGLDADGAWDAAVALAEHHQAPVWVAPLSSRCSFPESHPLFAGFLPANEADISRLLTGHDLIVTLGAPVFTYHYEMPGQIPPEGATLVQIVSDPKQAASAVCGTSLVGDLDLSLRALQASAADPRPKRPAPCGRSRRLRPPGAFPRLWRWTRCDGCGLPTASWWRRRRRAAMTSTITCPSTAPGASSPLPAGAGLCVARRRRRGHGQPWRDGAGDPGRRVVHVLGPGAVERGGT